MVSCPTFKSILPYTLLGAWVPPSPSRFWKYWTGVLKAVRLKHAANVRLAFVNHCAPHAAFLCPLVWVDLALRKASSGKPKLRSGEGNSSDTHLFFQMCEELRKICLSHVHWRGPGAGDSCLPTAEGKALLVVCQNE